MLVTRYFRRATVLAMGFAGALAVAAPPAASQDIDGLTIGSASVGGDFFVLGTAMQQILAETWPDGKFENSVTAGSVETPACCAARRSTSACSPSPRSP